LLTAAAVLIVPSVAAAFQPLGQRGTGTLGGGAGQLADPYQPAVDAQGNLFVGDSSNSRISEFAPNGAFVKAFGKDVGGIGVNVCTSTCQAGTDDGTAGSMCFPDGLAIDPVSGNLVVGDECDDRVDVFAPDGTFIKAFGKDVGGSGVNVCTTSCQDGTSSGDAGGFDTPVGIAIDPSGTVFVGDSQNDRIAVLTLSGGFQRAFGANVGGAGVNTCTTSCAAGTNGSDAGQLNQASGVALDGAGNVLVGEASNNRVSVFTTGGTFVRAFGGDVGGPGIDVCTTSCTSGSTGGGDAGELDEPFEVGFDPITGEVLIPEFNAARVSAYTPSGSFVRTFGADVDQGGGAGFEVCTTLCQNGTVGTTPGSFDRPSGVTVDSHGTVYVSDSGNSRVQVFGEPAVQQPPSNVFSFGRLHRNKKKGTAILDVTVAGPGTLTGAGKSAFAKQLGAAQSKAHDAASTVQLLIKAKGKARRKLGRSGKAKVSLVVTFTPIGGNASSQPLKVKLLKVKLLKKG
jgi:hypothetical protein